MSSLEQKSADVSGPIINRTFRVAAPETVDLTPYKGAWITLFPSADMTILLAETYALAAAVATTQNAVDGSGVVTPGPTTGLTILANNRFDFRIPQRLGRNGECFLGIAGPGEMQFWVSSNVT